MKFEKIFWAQRQTYGFEETYKKSVNCSMSFPSHRKNSEAKKMGFIWKSYSQVNLLEEIFFCVCIQKELWLWIERTWTNCYCVILWWAIGLFEWCTGKEKDIFVIKELTGNFAAW